MCRGNKRRSILKASWRAPKLPVARLVFCYLAGLDIDYGLMIDGAGPLELLVELQV